MIMIKKEKQTNVEESKILISVKEACEYTGLSEKTMRSLMRNNGFMIRIGRRTLIHKDRFEKWLIKQTDRL